MDLKNKETQLFETLTKLDSIADLIKNSKEENSYLKDLSSNLEREKEELRQKSKSLEHEKNSILEELKIFENKLNAHDSGNQELFNKIDLIEKENLIIKDDLFKMQKELEDSRYKVIETANINKNLQEEVNATQTELQATKEQLEEILKNKKMFVKKIDELSQETDAMLGEFDKW
jgi:chromosome segregation ATPase